MSIIDLFICGNCKKKYLGGNMPRRIRTGQDWKMFAIMNLSIALSIVLIFSILLSIENSLLKERDPDYANFVEFKLNYDKLNPYYKEILLRAKLSYEVACRKVKEEELKDYGLQVAGSYNQITNQISVNQDLPIEEQESVSLHELVHKRQDENSLIHNCGNSLGIMLNELEAYFVEYNKDVYASIQENQ